MEFSRKTPGELIAEDLERHGWQQRDMAGALEVDPSWLSRLRNGKMRVNARRAKKLAAQTGRDALEYMVAQAWLDLQNDHDEPPQKARSTRFQGKKGRQ